MVKYDATRHTHYCFWRRSLECINRGFYELLRELPINALHFLEDAHFEYHRTLTFLERFCGTLTVEGDGVYVNYSSMGQQYDRVTRCQWLRRNKPVDFKHVYKNMLRKVLSAT